MLAIVSLYGLASGLAAVLALTHNAFITAFCIAFMSCASYIGGRELHLTLVTGKFSQKIGRCVYAVILLLIGYYLSRHQASSVDLYLRTLPGLWWFMGGAGLGFVASSAGLRA